MNGRIGTSLGRILPAWARRAASGLAAAAAFASPAQAQTGTMGLGVVSATDGAPVAGYRYIINVDNTGQTLQRTPGDGCSPSSPGYPASCLWVSVAGAASTSPVYTQGGAADFAAGPLTLPAGRYLVSVLADGYKLDGEHFTIPLDPARHPGGVVTVRMQPTPLPTATIQAAVFEDISPVNGAPDLPAEHGLAGFQGHIADYLGEVTTDIFGSPLCTVYDAAGTPVPGSGGACLSKCYVVSGGLDAGEVPADAAGRCPTTTDGIAGTLYAGGVPAAGLVVEGKLKIPNLGPNRYALSITPPDGRGWVQTTTLEGNLDWDAWVMEGATGLDTEFVVAGEPFPAVIFGYVPAGLNTLAAGAAGSISGVVAGVKVYVPTVGGIGGLPGTIWGGMAGAKLDRPIAEPWVALTDLTNGDTAVWVGRGSADGSFTIPGVPAGNYTITWWDADLNHILDLVNVTVADGEAVDLGILPLAGWWTRLEGYVFNDTNRNGIRDPGEPGVPNYALTVRKRENSLMDRGGTAVTTDQTGHWIIENGYPLTQWLVLEAYNDLYYTTGVTFQADNQPAPTTVLGAGVDVSFLPIIGLAGTIDWGVHSYQPFSGDPVDPMNGGIVGTVSYDTTRNELDPRYAAVEDWQPGIPGLTVRLHAPVDCPSPVPAGTICSAGFPRYVLEADGSYRKGALLNTYVTETWQRPGTNGDGVCIPRNVDGNRMAYPADQQVTASDADCLEGPLMGVQFQNGFSTVDGNYGFAEGCFTGTLDAADPAAPVCTGGAFEPLPGGRDYLVEVVIPDDATGRPLYQVTREEDINIANGDAFVPAVPPPACAGPLHFVDVAGILPDDLPPTTLASGVVVPASTPTVNPTFVDIGGSPFEGQAKPLCNVKLVSLANGRSIVPTFNLFTDVPIPGRFWGLVVDDLNFSSNPQSLNFGEKAGVPFAPVGIYDYTNRLITTVESDFNGLFDVLLPSTNRISCPTPSGVCANLYRFVGNDPGLPGRLNPNYKPEFRTIAAEFEAFPGLLVPADLAPTQVGVTVQLPGGQANQVRCELDAATPQLFAVDRPYVRRGGSAAARTFTIRGRGFGATQGTGAVTLDGSPLAVVSWADTQIQATVPNSGTLAVAPGPHQLAVAAANGQRTVNGLTFHVLGSAGGVTYARNVYEVGPGRTYAPVESLPLAADHAIQRALDDAAASAGPDLVVVYPNLPSADPRQNPRGAYYENLILTRPVKLQGVGPGGILPDGSVVPGSIVDGGAFGGDGPVAADWYARILGLTWLGNPNVNDGAVISIYATTAASGAFPAAYAPITAPSIDGFDLRGGDQQGFPTNINVIGGGATGQPAGLVTQGGAIFANGYARNLQITNNVIQNNGGAYGTVRIGTPDLPDPSNHNEQVRIASNRIVANAGTNLAGAIGLFAGADRYEVAGNDICGNFSAEYGGGISAYGFSPGGRIHHNRIWFNRSYDEGGGIMIAGQLPADPATLSPGSGPVDVYANRIQANLANDDGGGIRFLMAGNSLGLPAPLNLPMNVYNNFIVNNVSTHEGGGVSLNDAPAVRFFNNTVMKNLTTATAVTSTGFPAPAGLSSSANSVLLQASLPAGAPTFSDPVLFNNVFWDNRAGTRSGATVVGLGMAGDATPVNHWDLGVADGTGLLSPTSSVLQVDTGTVPSASNLAADPLVAAPYDVSVTFNAWRNNPAFRGAILVAVDLPPTLMGDYHLSAGSPAQDAGAASTTVAGVTVAAPATDVDDGARPQGAGYDIGADELGAGAGGGTTPGAFPTTPILDTFNRAPPTSIFPVGLGGSWGGDTTLLSYGISRNSGSAGYNQVTALLGGNAWWSAQSFGPNQEAYFTFQNVTGTEEALLLKVNGNATALGNAYSAIEVVRLAGTVEIRTHEAGLAAWTSRASFPATFAAGDVLGARAQVDGSVSVYKNGVLVGSANVTSGAAPWPTALAQAGGYVGVRFVSAGGARFDDFGGGTMP